MSYLEVGTLDTWGQYVETVPSYIKPGKVYKRLAKWQVIEDTHLVIFYGELALPIGLAGDTPVYIQRGGSAARQETYVTTFSRKSVEYYTPPGIIEPARTVMGGIDVDPASCEIAQRWIQAGVWYDKEENGLAQPWRGKIWLNPPWGKVGGKSSQKLWSEKLMEEYEAGRVKEAILLVKAALGYAWFEYLWHLYPVCFPRKRPTFLIDENTPAPSGAAKQGVALFYLGRYHERFRTIFEEMGRVIAPPGGIQ
jgi:hypothetical protein